MEEEEEVDNQLFVDDQGAPLKFYLHKSIKQPGARFALETKIELHGGAISATDAGSNVILVNPNHPSGDRDSIRHAYKTHSNPELKGVYVESMGWVNNCVKIGKCIHHFIQKGMGGVVGDRERTAFTEDDDYRLARHLAILVPDKSDGGRLGNNIYILLMKNADNLPDEYDWVLRHTWQSWRQRYKMNQEWFDERITELAAKLKPAPHQKYHLSRKAIHRPARQKTGDEMYGPEEEEESEEEEEEGHAGPSSRKRPISGSGSIRREAKRMRIDSTPPPHDDGVQDVGTASKGKEKAPSEEDDDDYGSDNSLFDGPYDPSQQTPLPPRTQLGHSSQATLVGTVPPYGVPPQASIAPPNVQEPSPRRQQPARPKRMSVAHPIDPRPTPPKQTAAPETPYRSTRARSGSLTPYADDPNAIIRKNRQKGKKKTLETLDERRLEEEREALSREPEGNAETQEVADLLMAANDQSGISDGGNTVDDLDHMPPPRSTTRRAAGQPTLETDDAQTDQALRRPQVPFLPSAREILKSLGGPRLSRQPESVTSKAPSVSSPRLAQNSPPDVFMASSRRQGPIIDLSSPFYSQSAAGRSSVSRKSSSDSFPINGTRAKKVKQDIKKQEKHTPYRPPAGTRAEDVLKSR